MLGDVHRTRHVDHLLFGSAAVLDVKFAFEDTAVRVILDLALVCSVLAVSFREGFAVSAPGQRQADVHVEHLEAIQASGLR
ncbi:MAG: hypothetical protein ACRDYA_25000 [Egibacteraceae bacterium]